MIRTFSCLPLAAVLSVGACGTPDFEPLADHSNIAPSGPKVTAIFQNLNCELATAKEDIHPVLLADGRSFTMKQRLSEIDYVVTALYSLEVTNTQGFAPSLNKIFPYATPMTNLTLAVGGQLSEAEDRNISLSTSIDFDKIVSEQASKTGGPQECSQGGELKGDLHLAEIIAMGLLAVSDEHSGIQPAPINEAVASTLTPPTTSSPSTPGASTITPVPPPQGAVTTQSINPYVFGVFGTITDFTITEGLSGGPNWTLAHLKGPNAGMANILSASRVVKDQVTISFVPACRHSKITAGPGFPDWGNSLPICTEENKSVSYSDFNRDLSPRTPLDAAKNAASNAGASNVATQILEKLAPTLGVP